MSAAVSGFGRAGAAALLAPASPDVSSASSGDTAFGSALLFALAGGRGGPAQPGSALHPAPSADAGSAETSGRPGSAPPAPGEPGPGKPAVAAALSGLCAPVDPGAQDGVSAMTPSTAPAASQAASQGTVPGTPGDGSPAKPSGPARAPKPGAHHDLLTPADVLAAGQLAAQQAMAVPLVAAANPQTAAAATATPPAAGDAVTAPAAAPGPARATVPAPRTSPAASLEPGGPTTPGAGPQPPAEARVSAPARPAQKPSPLPAESGPKAEQAALPSAGTLVPAQPPAAAPFAAPAAPPPAAASAAAGAPPLQQQLAQPVMSLARQPGGDHVVVVRVAPDDLGPVTVHARVSDTGVHIELFAPSDAGRDAIRQILGDLRRDLNATTANATVSVSDQNAPGADSRGGDRSPWTSAGGDGAAERGPAATPEPPDEPLAAAWSAVPDIPIRSRVVPGAQTLDIVV